MLLRQNLPYRTRRQRGQAADFVVLGCPKELSHKAGISMGIIKADEVAQLSHFYLKIGCCPGFIRFKRWTRKAFSCRCNSIDAHSCACSSSDKHAKVCLFF